ncbi:MAG: amino acid ABC transporter substrate-binding protein [Anaerolineae bacterium]|nr:amino acid ABC transporter substrate-binding protein [Anaerolineae bacterium]
MARTECCRTQTSSRDNGEVIPPPRSCTLSRPHRGSALAAPSLIGLVLLVLLSAACSRRATALDRIQETGLLRVAVDPAFPPFESVNDAGQIVGLDADLATALAQGLGADVHFVTTGYDALYDALTVGHADIIVSALYPDPSRTAAFAFSRPYFNAGDVLVVPNGSGIAGAADLAGTTVACVFGTTGHMAALEWQASLQPAPALVTVDSPVTLTTTLQDGTADAVILDHVSAQMAAGNAPWLQILSPPVTDEPYVIASRQEDADLMAALDTILEELESDGTLDTLIEDWMQP